MSTNMTYSAAQGAAAVVVLLGAILGVAQPAFAGRDSIECGSVVVADLTLKGDVGPCPGDGLTVVANGITVNLNGYKVFALRRQNTGIRLANVSNVIVKGGAVDGFDSGILLVSGSNNKVTNIIARNNRTGIRIDDAKSGMHTLEKNTVIQNRIFGVLATSVSNTSISKNNVRDNANNGIVLDGDSYSNSISHNEIQRNAQQDIELRKSALSFSYQNLVPPQFATVSPIGVPYVEGVDFRLGSYVPELTDVTARVVPVGVVLGAGASALDNPLPADTSTSGCTVGEYAAAGLNAGDIALVQRGTCLLAQKVDMALRAGARVVIVFNEGQSPYRITHEFGFFPANFDGISSPAVVIFTSYQVGFDLYNIAKSNPVYVRIVARSSYTATQSGEYTYNNIIEKNIAGTATDENSFCANLTNQWIKNSFTIWNRPCVGGGDTSEGGDDDALGSRARLY